MLTPFRLIPVCLLTIICITEGEKLFHSRDHSDVKIPSSQQQPELITTGDTAKLFLSKYGFIQPVNWEDIQPGEEQSSAESSDLDPPFYSEEGELVWRTGSTRDPENSLEFISALKEFQRVTGLPVTGVFDDATKAAMNKPRCGVPDKEPESAEHTETNWNSTSPSNTSETNRTFTTAPLNSTTGDKLSQKPRHLAILLGKRRKREAEELGYMAFSKVVLKWRLIGEGYSSQLSIDEQRYIFRLAFRMWSEVSPLEFVEDSQAPLEDIDIKLGFGRGRHLGCTQKFDGAGREFAHAWFLGDIHFDDDEYFTAPNTGNGISLLKVAVHEIGHVLGLPHIFRSGSIMQPNYLPQEANFEIDWLDRKSLQQLYGSCSGRFDAVFDWIRKERTSYGEVVVRFSTYFMRDGWYWLYENRNNRTRYGDPVPVQVGWHGIPASGVDAYVHVWTRREDSVYFFKGLRYWRYDSENDQAFTEDEEGHHYPMLISEGFPGVPSPIDTALFDRRDSSIYFFRGMQVFAFDIRANSLVSSFPKKITDVFPAVQAGNHPFGNLDAAYFSYTHNTIFLLKGTTYWRMVSSRDRWRRPSMPSNGLLPGREVDKQWFDICNVHNSALKVARR
ncbi:matrix metallopeptidase-21 [Denticeps clupeoides]|uniref:Peptidase metallopeptidase domain-containing protein n=1 Tax=Denticeps clupeoides TaxID=299321 RepID=A0AAY4DLI6_9TELE|nr:matrix metalloproteinase-21 [Denticeps clupeoides]